jgi:hypothetical protein
MFGVIICPKCHRARGVSLSAKKVRCSHCGKSIDISLAKVYHRTESQEELARAVRRLTERLAVSIDEYPAERRRRAREPPALKPKATCTEEELQVLAIQLTADQGDFSVRELMVAAGVGEEEARLLLQRMLDSALVFEPATGRFRALRS